MRKPAPVVLCLCIMLGLLLAPAAAQGSSSSPRARPVASREPLSLPRQPPAFAPGEVLVHFSSVARAISPRESISAAGGRLIDRFPRFDVGVAELRPGLSVREGVRRLSLAPGIGYAEPNYLRYAAAVPNDTYFTQQWGLNNTGQDHPIADPPPETIAGLADADIDAVEAWDTTQGTTDTVIAVLDSGVDVTHPDLNDNLWVNPGETADNGEDDDGNGYTDDIHGFDFVGAGDRDLLADTEVTCEGLDAPRCVGWDHGTHVAGIVGAEMNNSTGVAGVCPGCRIMALKFFKPADTDDDGVKDTMVGDVASELEALDYAAGMDADIVNGSFGGGPVWSRAERAAFKTLGNQGVLAVLAAGNTNGDNDSFASYHFDNDDVPDSSGPTYPATYNLLKIISVAASDHRDRYGLATGCDADTIPVFYCTFTNWGHDSVDLAAPGVDIMSTLPGSNYAAFNGTSMATPAVAGIAGLVKSQRPLLGPLQIKNAVMNSVDHPTGLDVLKAFPGGVLSGSFTRTDGRVNALAALSAPTTNATPVTDGNVNGARGIDRWRKGTVSFPADENDLYRRRLVRGARYRVALDGPARQDFALVVYKPGTKEVWQLESGCFGLGGRCRVLLIADRADASRADEARTFRAPKTGTYFIQVHSFMSAGTYTLTVRRP